MQPPLVTSPEGAKQAGYKAGQAIQQKDLSDRDLSVQANQQYDVDGVPMTLFSWYRDGLIAGYQAKKQEGDTEQKRLS